MGNDPAAMRELTELMMAELQKLSGQEYVDIYATKAKELIAEGVDPAHWSQTRWNSPKTD